MGVVDRVPSFYIGTCHADQGREKAFVIDAYFTVLGKVSFLNHVVGRILVFAVFANLSSRGFGSCNGNAQVFSALFHPIVNFKPLTSPHPVISPTSPKTEDTTFPVGPNRAPSSSH